MAAREANRRHTDPTASGDFAGEVPHLARLQTSDEIASTEEQRGGHGWRHHVGLRSAPSCFGQGDDALDQLAIGGSGAVGDRAKLGQHLALPPGAVATAKLRNWPVLKKSGARDISTARTTAKAPKTAASRRGIRFILFLGSPTLTGALGCSLALTTLKFRAPFQPVEEI